MSSKRHQRRRGCQGKRGFHPEAAETAVRAMNERNLAAGLPLVESYRCACGQIHIGHRRMPTARRANYRWVQSRWVRGVGG